MMTRAESETWLDRHRTPEHVRRHCKKVAKVGEWLAHNLKKAGVPINPEVVWLAGNLHDIVRTVDMKHLGECMGTSEDYKVWEELRRRFAGQHHADAAADLLNEGGEAQLADIVRRHKYTSLLTPEGPQDWESKVLYYADKRVAHDQIVPLKHRLEEGRARHFGDTKKMKEEEETERAVEALEREIFSKMNVPFSPNELNEETMAGE